MRRTLLICVLSVVAMACSDDKDDKVTPGIQNLCAAQCDRADDCGFLEGSKPGQCQADCESAQTRLSNGDCSFTEGELDICADAFSAQECSGIENQEVPAVCMKTCQVVRD